MGSQSKKDIIEGIFLKLTLNYGTLWSSQFNSDDMCKFALNEWLMALTDIKDEHIFAAMDKYIKENPEFPPHLAKFIHYCKLVATVNPAHKEYKALPEPKERWSTKQDAHEQCQKILNLINKREPMPKVEVATWEEPLYEPTSKKYSEGYADKRRKYLMGLTDVEACSLKPEDAYDRVRFLTEWETNTAVKKRKEGAHIDTVDSLNTKKRAAKVYRDYSGERYDH